MIGAEAELAAGLELARDHRDRAGVHHPALGVARLGPGVGMEQIDEAERSVGDAAQHGQGIAHMEADIAERAVANMAKRGDDTVQERLAADEAMVGQQIGAPSHMLAAAEADLEMEWAVIAEQIRGGDRPFVRHGHGGQ